MALQEITSDEIFGIAKKFNRELDALPMHTHSAICEMVRVGMQHRNLAMQDADRREKADREERVLKIQEYQIEQHKKTQDAAIAATMTGEQPPPN